MSQPRRDYYAVLGVAPSATPAEISHAYRELLRRHHPDTRGGDDPMVGTGADAELQRVIAAYAVLRDPDSRADYDEQSRPSSTPRVHRQPRPNPMRPPIVAGPVRWQRSATRTENHV